MDIGANEITDTIVNSSSDYLVEYSPIFLMIGGLVLALAVIGALIDRFYPDDQYRQNERRDIE